MRKELTLPPRPGFRGFLQVVACTLVYDYIRKFVGAFSEGDIEMLLVLLQSMAPLCDSSLSVSCAFRKALKAIHLKY